MDFATVFTQLAVATRTLDIAVVNPTIAGDPTASGLVVDNTDSIFRGLAAFGSLLLAQLGGYTDTEAAASSYYGQSYAAYITAIDSRIAAALANATIAGNGTATAVVQAFRTEWLKLKALVPSPIVSLLGPTYRTAI